jgi:hypothetical protein
MIRSRLLAAPVLAALIATAGPVSAQEVADPPAVELEADAGPSEIGIGTSPEVAQDAAQGDELEDVTDPTEDPAGALAELQGVQKAKGWGAALGLLVLMLVKVLRRRLARLPAWLLGDFFKTAAGGYVFTAATAALVAFGNDLMVVNLGWGTLLDAAIAAIVSLALSRGEDARVANHARLGNL